MVTNPSHQKTDMFYLMPPCHSPDPSASDTM